MLFGLFESRSTHPLAEPRELQRVISGLPLENPARTVDEIGGWLESVRNADDLTPPQRFAIVDALDEAVQGSLRRLQRDYVASPRLSRPEEKRLSGLSINCWEHLARTYESCLQGISGEHKQARKAAEALRNRRSLLHARQLWALQQRLKWALLRYAEVPEWLWQRLGQAYLAAVASGCEHEQINLFARQPGVVTPGGLYLQALVLHASSTNSLLPLEIDLADRLLAQLLGSFAFAAQALPNTVFWIDVAGGQPPRRLAVLPQALTPTLRFFTPQGVAPQLHQMLAAVAAGELPAGCDLGGQVALRQLEPVLQHLAAYWEVPPPQRLHVRHAVHSRLSVLNGFDDALMVFAGEVARLGKERAAESWVVDNVSLGGFGALIDAVRCDWLRVGSLLCLQPEGGDNWLLGVVRRFARETEIHARVGIQTLARSACSVQLLPSSSLFGHEAYPGIYLELGSDEGLARFVLPVSTYDAREVLEYERAGQRWRLTPVELIETGATFEIASYRESVWQAEAPAPGALPAESGDESGQQSDPGSDRDAPQVINYG